MAKSRRPEEYNRMVSNDDDDDAYWNHSSARNPWGEEEDESLEQIQAKISQSQRRQDESLDRSLAVVHETTQIGISTAEELANQGEKLDEAERKLESIDEMTTVTQRHLNSIKSVFGGIKNWFQQKGEAKSDSRTKDYPHSRLRDDISTLQEHDEVHHPVISSQPHKAATSSQPPHAAVRSHPHRAARLDEEDEFRDISLRPRNDHKLEMLSSGIGNLKSLGLSLGTELDRQNDQITRLMPKTEKVDDKIRNQNSQISRILHN